MLFTSRKIDQCYHQKNCSVYAKLIKTDKKPRKEKPRFKAQKPNKALNNLFKDAKTFKKALKKKKKRYQKEKRDRKGFSARPKNPKKIPQKLFVTITKRKAISFRILPRLKKITSPKISSNYDNF